MNAMVQHVLSTLDACVWLDAALFNSDDRIGELLTLFPDNGTELMEEYFGILVCPGVQTDFKKSPGLPVCALLAKDFLIRQVHMLHEFHTACTKAGVKVIPTKPATLPDSWLYNAENKDMVSKYVRNADRACTRGGLTQVMQYINDNAADVIGSITRVRQRLRTTSDGDGIAMDKEFNAVIAADREFRTYPLLQYDRMLMRIKAFTGYLCTVGEKIKKARDEDRCRLRSAVKDHLLRMAVESKDERVAMRTAIQAMHTEMEDMMQCVSPGASDGEFESYEVITMREAGVAVQAFVTSIHTKIKRDRTYAPRLFYKEPVMAPLNRYKQYVMNIIDCEHIFTVRDIFTASEDMTHEESDRILGEFGL